MPLTVRQFPCLSDNYGFLVRDEGTGHTACIDTPDVDAILREVHAFGGRLDLILNTHWHPDHAGGNEAIKAATGAQIVGPKEVERISPLDRIVGEGDVVELGRTRLQVLDTGGHTLQHITYYDPEDRIAFVGDTIFALGCGRLFEGTAEQMWRSLQKIAALPDDTTIYCAHEYTASNARFALSVDGSPALKKRAEEVFAARERCEPTVPTTVAMEKATNPFLRAPMLRPDLPAAQAFADIRGAKDVFQ